MAVVEAKMFHTAELKPFVLESVQRTGRHLGVGSYGTVEELRVSGALCAGKKLHETLLDPLDEGVDCMLERFASECRLMAELRHPHVVQFMGLCYLPGVNPPVLVMERMDTSLDQVLEKRSDIPFSLKRSILLDVSRGLVYLHGHSPPIIHRDLTARNVLFTPSMHAKIADLGNARMVEPHKLTKTMSSAPGTLVYMPPEATRVQSRYSAKLDMFSFGHLALFTAIQESPHDLLPSTYPDPANEEDVKARNEVQRREPYMKKLYKGFGKEHPLVKLIRQCLHNVPERRPGAVKVMEMLEALDLDEEAEDPYTTYEGMNKLDMMQFMLKKKGQEAAEARPPPSSRPLPPTPPPPPPQVLAEQKVEEPNHQQMRVKQIQSGTASMMAKYKSGMIKGWKPYIFKIANATHIQCLDPKSSMEKLHGELQLSAVTTVDIPPHIKGSQFPFALHFIGKGSPWVINAYSEEERKCWMEAIRPGSTSEPQVPKPLVLYDFIPDDLFQDEGEDIYDDATAATEVYADVSPPFDPPLPPLPTRTLPPPLPTRPPPPPQNVSDNESEEDIYDIPVPDSSQPADESLYDDPELYADLNLYAPPQVPDPPAPTPPNQIYVSGKDYTILPMTTQHKDDEESYMSLIYEPPKPSLLPTPPMRRPPPSLQRPPPLPTQHPPPPSSQRPPPLPTQHPPPPSLQRPPPLPTQHPPPPPSQRPPPPSSQRPPPLPTQHPPPPSWQHPPPLPAQHPPPLPTQHAPPPSVHPPAEKGQTQAVLAERVAQYLDPTQLGVLIQMLQRLQGKSAPSERLPAAPLPTASVVPPPQDSNLELLLESSATMTSDRMLVTEEDEEECYEPRPEWAKASTLSNAGSSSLSALQKDALYIPRSALHGLQPIGEGQFGKVYKATLMLGSRVTVAVKTIRRYTSEKERQDFMREMAIMAQMMHPNIIQLYGLVNEGPDVPAPWMVLEYLPYGDLKNFLTSYSRPVEQLVKYMIDVAMGMHYLSEKGLVHRDLAARNVIVGKNELCKVADFGLLRELPEDDSIYVSKSSVPCPVRWMAPESIRNREFSTATDVWSFGILQWEMFNPTKLPYQSMENMKCAVMVAQGYRLPLPRGCPSVVGRVMKACWHHNPVKRPSFLLISTLLSTKVTFGK